MSPSVVCAVRLAFLGAIVVAASAHIHECVTPNSLSGSCVPLKDCRELEPLFANITGDNYVFLRRSQCGFSNFEPEVCCKKPGAQKKTFRLPPAPERHPKVTLGSRFGTPKKGLPEPGDGCGSQMVDNRIFFGMITAIDEFPWMALMGYKHTFTERSPDGRHGFKCGGSLIHRRYVMTAAHCVTGLKVDNLGGLVSVRLGEYNIDSKVDCDPIAPTDCAPEAIDVKIAEIITHPSYNPKVSEQHDIALVRLAKDVEFNDFVSPICLKKGIGEAVFAHGQIHWVCGWGDTEQGRNSPIKLKVELPIVEPKTCQPVYRLFNINLGKSQICAGGNGKKDSCVGDSGGPLMVPSIMKEHPEYGSIWFATGVVSVGPNKCGTKNIPGLYTKVNDYYDWIAQNIKD